jgi:hypothetical protein
MSHVAKYRTEWLENFYTIHADWVNRKDAPYAFVIPAGQRDPYETRQMLDILRTGDVEVHKATAPFTAGGKQYPAGSYVVKLAQPSGAFAKTMLERQQYPDLRQFPGGPPKAPYDVTGHTLWMLMGVTVDQVDQPFEATLAAWTGATASDAAPVTAGWGYAIGPESNIGYLMAARLQAAKVPVFRAAAAFAANGTSFAPGTWLIPSAGAQIVAETAGRAGVDAAGLRIAPAVDAYRLRPETRVGLWRAANNMPGGWMKWLFEQYQINFHEVASTDFAADLAAKYDAIVLPDGTSRNSIVRGLDPARNDKEWTWAYGVGEDGWTKLGDWVRNGGTLVAIGSAVDTARELLDLPIEKALPEPVGRGGRGAAAAAPGGGRGAAPDPNRVLRDAFASPAQLDAALRERVIDPTSLFYCPGSLLQNEFNPAHPVAFGMPKEWPVFFESDQAWRLRPGFDIQAEVVARYPKSGRILQSGWLLGEDLLRDQANVIAFKVGKGYVVTEGSQVDFRAQPHATFKLLFNAIFHGPSTRVSASELAKLAGSN